MMSEEPSRIRPVWLIGGAAGLIFLGICAFLSVCALIAFIWFTSQTSSNAAQATQAAFQRQTEQVAAPTRVIPTPLPAVITIPPSPPTAIPVSSPAPNMAARLAPDQFVRTYYALVSQQRYDLTWAMLTDAFKQKFNCCAPSFNYSEYLRWWDSVNYVDFGAVSTVSQSEDRAVVYVELYYVMNTGARSSVDRDPYIHLVYDSTLGNWRFDDKRATP